MYFSTRWERKEGKTEQETWVEHFWRKRKWKGFENAKWFLGWSCLFICLAFFPSAHLAVSDRQHGSVCLVPCSLYQLAARVPTRSTWFTRRSDRGSSLATVLRALEVTIEDNTRYFDLFVHRMWVDDMACDSSVLQRVAYSKTVWNICYLIVILAFLIRHILLRYCKTHNFNSIFWYYVRIIPE